MSSKFAVLGDGAWGTAIALLLAKDPAHQVCLWSAREENGRLLRERRENVHLLPGIPIPPSVRLTTDIRDAIQDADVIMMLRVQLERQHEASFPASEYFRFYGLRLEHLDQARPDAIVMHPGPINRGRELSSEVADFQRSVILNQVENGIAVRMAVLEKVIG